MRGGVLEGELSCKLAVHCPREVDSMHVLAVGLLGFLY